MGLIARIPRFGGSGLDVLTLLVSRFGTRGVQAVAFVLLARFLTPAQLGAYGLITSTIYLAGQIGHLGLRQSAARMIGQAHASTGEIVPALLACWAPLALATCAVVIATSLGATEGLGGAAPLWIGTATASLILIALTQGIFLGRGQVGWFAVSDGAPGAVLALLIGLAMLSGGMRPDWALPAFALGFVTTAVVALIAGLKGVGRLSLRLSLVPAMVRQGLPFALSMFVIFLNGRIALFVLGRTGDADAVGHLFAAQRLTDIVLEVATAAGLTLFSRAVRSSGSASPVRAAATTISLLFWVFAGLALVLALLAPTVIWILLGSTYLEAASIVRILAISLPFAAAVKLLNGVISGDGRPWIAGAVALGGAVLTGGISVLASVLWGAEGVATAMVVSQFAAFAGYLFLCWRTYRVTPFELLFAINLRRTAE